MIKSYFNIITIFTLIMLLAMSRLVPHPPNFTPIIAMAVLSGAFLNNRLLSFTLPLLAMFISDLFLGFHSGMFVVYFSISICVLLGFFISKKPSFANSIVALSASVFVFYLITNFFVWYNSGLYPQTIEGLISCYILALPFVQNTLVSTLIFGLGSFLIYYRIQKYLIFSTKNQNS